MIREVKIFKTIHPGYPTREDIENCIDIAIKNDILVKIEYILSEPGSIFFKERYILINKDSKVEDFSFIKED
jgi:hypothetical protein